MECQVGYCYSETRYILMKVLITGVSGFIGNYVLKKLSKNQNLEIIGISRSKYKNKKKFKNVKLINYDIKNIDKTFLEDFGLPDKLIHLAWGNLPNYYDVYHIEEELEIQKRFLDALIDAGLKDLFVSGTCFEYGSCEGEITENNPTNPNNVYGKAKLELLNYLIKKKALNSFSLTWGRLFYMYGNGQNNQSLWQQFQKSIIEKKKTFDVAGDQLRDYLHVDEIAKHIVFLSLNNDNLGIINICSGKPISIKNLVNEWASVQNASIKINENAFKKRKHDPPSFWGNNQKLVNLYKENLTKDV